MTNPHKQQYPYTSLADIKSIIRQSSSPLIPFFAGIRDRDDQKIGNAASRLFDYYHFPYTEDNQFRTLWRNCVAASDFLNEELLYSAAELAKIAAAVTLYDLFFSTFAEQQEAGEPCGILLSDYGISFNFEEVFITPQTPLHTLDFWLTSDFYLSYIGLFDRQPPKIIEIGRSYLSTAPPSFPKILPEPPTVSQKRIADHFTSKVYVLKE